MKRKVRVMGSMLFSDAWIFQGEDGFIRGSFLVSGDRIRSIQPVSQPVENRVISLHGLRVIPGLIDIHTHGNSGFDFSDGSAEGLLAMGRYLASHGITSFASTSGRSSGTSLELTSSFPSFNDLFSLFSFNLFAALLS